MARAARRMRRGGPDRGSLALELAVCVPIIVVMVLAVIGMGRVARAHEMVVGASTSAARAASLASNPAAARIAAQRAAEQDLAAAGVSCVSLSVTSDTSAFRPGGQVSATVRCTASLSGLALAGLPGQHTLGATASSPIERYRALGAAP